MLQPFVLFEKAFIPRLQQLKKRWLVSQTYFRAQDPLHDTGKVPLLLTDYEDLGQARIHKNAVKQDPMSAVIDLGNEEHFNKLQDMLKPDSRYSIYWGVVRDAEKLKKQVDAKYKENMKRYIEKNTNWRLNRDTTIYPNMEVTFGEIFITIKHGSQRLRVKFEEIEGV